jgi:hypothetical protein
VTEHRCRDVERSEVMPAGPGKRLSVLGVRVRRTRAGCLWVLGFDVTYRLPYQPGILARCLDSQMGRRTVYHTSHR